MRYRTLGKTGIEASAVAFGGILLRGQAQADADRMVARAIDGGVTYFDVAPSYGDAQDRLGPALQPYRRRVTLACKSDGKTAGEINRDLEDSLRALRTDCLDVYQLHSCDDRLDTVLGPGGALEAMVKAREAGKVRFLGFSSHRERSALYLMSQFDFDTVMQPMNWANNLKIGKSDLAYALAARRGMGILAIKALAHRPLAEGEPRRFPNCWYLPIVGDDRLAELAMKFTLSRAQVAVSPGAFEILSLMLSLIDRPGMGEPPTAEETGYLAAEAEKVRALFPD